MGWFKMWDREWLQAWVTTPLETQGACLRVLCLANTIIDNGRFSYEKKIPLSIDQIIRGCDITKDQWEQVTKAQFVIEKDGFWEVRNFNKFQNEYQRQKGYREKLQPKVTSKTEPVDFSLKPLAFSLNNPKKQKDPPTATPSASPQAVFVDWFKSAYQSRHGKPYADTKADYIQMAPVLKSFNNNFEMLKQLVEAGWNTPDEKNGYSIAGQCMTVKGFCSVVNKIILKPSKPKTAYELKQEALNHGK